MSDPESAADTAAATATATADAGVSMNTDAPAAAAAPGPAEVAVDPEFDQPRDSDSSLGDDDIGSYTTSLASDIRNHVFQHGRRWHAYKAGRYIMPNDEQENERLDIFHHMCELVLGGRLHLAPVGKAPARILDVGCGTGLWAVEAADEYPSAQVLGCDLSPIQPSMIPPNAKFEIDDVEEEWTHNEPFDYIHARYLSGAIADWPKLTTQMFTHTKPGGYTEIQDFDYIYFSDDGSLSEDHAIKKWVTMLCRAALEKNKRDACPGPKLKGWMQDAGFINVEERIFRIPIGPWPANKDFKRIGEWNRLQLLEGMESMSIYLLVNVLGWQMDEMKVLLAQVRNDLMDRRIHAQMLLYAVYGQKPQ